MFNRIPLFLLPLIFFINPVSRAQDTFDNIPESSTRDNPVIQLSLKQAVDIALSPDGNTRIRIAEELVQQSKARSVQSRAALLPNVDAYVGQQNTTRNLEAFGLGFRSTIPGYDFPTFVGPYNVFDARASASLNVLNLSSIRRYQASRKGIGQAEAEQEFTRDQVRSDVIRLYLSLLKAQAGEDAAQSSTALAQKLLTLAENQKSAGAGTGIEITRAQVQLANERQRLLSASNERNRARFQLLRALGLDLNLQVEPVERMAYKPVEIYDPQAALEIAMDSRSDWKAQKEREETARLNHSASRWERLPSVGIFGDYGTIGTGIDNAVPTRTFGFTVQIPIFDGGSMDGKRVESASQLRQEQEVTRDLAAQIEMDIRLALDSLQSADLLVSAAEDGFKLAENELAQAQRRFKAGVGSSIEVTGAQTRLERARESRIQAVFSHNAAKIDLYSAMGTIKQMIPGE